MERRAACLCVLNWLCGNQSQYFHGAHSGLWQGPATGSAVAAPVIPTMLGRSRTVQRKAEEEREERLKRKQQRKKKREARSHGSALLVCFAAYTARAVSGKCWQACAAACPCPHPARLHRRPTR